MAFFSPKLTLPVTASKKTFNYALEALRGVAALFVLLSHALVNSPTPDPTYRLTGIWQYAPPGHLSVIIFFLLSGFVIGVSNTAPIRTTNERKLYLKKRLIRLYPLYLVALALTIIVAIPYFVFYSPGTILAFLLFLQGVVVKVPAFNQPLWSLGYEISYYLMFLLVSAKNWSAQRVAYLFLMLALLSSILPPPFTILSSFAYGAVFWFIGLYLVSLPKNTNPPDYGIMLMFLVLMLSFERLNIIGVVLHSLRVDARGGTFFDSPIICSDLSDLVLCFPLLLAFTNRTIPGQHWLTRIALAVPGAFLISYIVSGKINQPGNFNSVVLPTIFYSVALVLYTTRTYFTRWGSIIIQKLEPLGLISYGVYIIHYPLIYAFQLIKPYSGTLVTFLIRQLIYLLVVLLVATLLERRLQPWIKKKLFQAAPA